MPKNKGPRAQSSTIRAAIFDRRLCAAVGVALAVVCGLVYFRNDLPTLRAPSIDAVWTERNIPSGSILIPDDNGLCRLHAIDSSTGQIRDDGLVDCANASDQNAAAWKSLVNEQKATQIRRSFRHD